MNKNELKSKIVEQIDIIRSKAGSINLMLSGGVDSGTLAGLGNPDKVYTVKLPYGSKHDEFNDVTDTVRHLHLEDRLIVVDLDESRFDEIMEKAVKIIGRPIPHYNIFPLYTLFEQMSKDGIKDVICGDGPDETMCGYTRHLIMAYLYAVLDFEAFSEYQTMITKVLGAVDIVYARLISKDPASVNKIFIDVIRRGGNILDCMCKADMELMRPDMDDMSNKLANSFGITIHRPYQDSEIDSLMYNLPPELKVYGIEYGKYLLRQVAGDVIPLHIAWRKQKIGGPLVPVNQIKGWKLDPFDKSRYLEYQKEILNVSVESRV